MGLRTSVRSRMMKSLRPRPRASPQPKLRLLRQAIVAAVAGAASPGRKHRLAGNTSSADISVRRGKARLPSECESHATIVAFGW